MKTLTYAPDAVKLLNGLFCIYKPCGLHHRSAMTIIKKNLSRDLNAMEVRPVKNLVSLEGSVASGKPLSVKLTQNFADHPLVVGERHQPQDLRLKTVNCLGQNISGVMVIAVNNMCWKANEITASNPLHVIEVKGEFGYATENFMHDGKVLEKATFNNIRQEVVDRVTSSIQASHQASAFRFANVPLESQAAYELASQGLVRPSGKTSTLLYNIRCTEFNLPYFTLQIQCINPEQEFFADMIHQIGIYVRSCAVCCQIRCLQYGHFTLDHALLRKHWTVEHILGNIVLCKDILDTNNVNEHNYQFQKVPKDATKSSFESIQELLRQDGLE